MSKELATDEPLYPLGRKVSAVTFEYAGQDTALVEIKANDGKPIGNDLIYGEIHGLKKNEDGNALGGAVIGLFKPDTEEFTTDTAILTATSAEDGSFSLPMCLMGTGSCGRSKRRPALCCRREPLP